MPYIRIERWGETYRLVELFNASDERPPPQPTVHEDSPNEEELHLMEEFTELRPGAEDAKKAERFLSSIIRARSKVREYALCQHWEYFATFTLADEKQDRFDIRGFIKDLGNWIQNYNKKYHCKLQYLIIPELHKNGAWHAHGLLRNVSPDSLIKNEYGYLDMPYYKKRFGFISLSKVKSHEKCASYVTKYISKDVQATAAHLQPGQHLYYASRGLAVKEVLWVASTPQHIQGGFKNEYGIFKWVKKEEALDYIRNDARSREEVLSHQREGQGHTDVDSIHANEPDSGSRTG